MALECEFCDLIHDSAKCLEEANTLTYCKARWGPVFDEALKHASIHVYHVTINGDHNIVWTCSYDVWKLDGYSRGPKGFMIDQEFGGLYVDSSLCTPTMC